MFSTCMKVYQCGSDMYPLSREHGLVEYIVAGVRWIEVYLLYRQSLE